MSATTASPRRLHLPFVTTRPAETLRWFVITWPLWWILGVDQFIVPAFALTLATFHAPGIFGSRLSSSAKWALASWLWMLLPAWRIEAEYRMIYLKYVLTYASQFAFLLLASQMTTEKDRDDLLDSLHWLGGWIALGGLIFVVGAWDGQIPTVLGMLLPDSVVTGSSFFESIGSRGFGVSGYEGELLDSRLTSFALKYSDLSFLTLLLFPLAAWGVVRRRGAARVFSFLTCVGLLVCLAYAQSRMAWMAFALGSVSSAWLCLAMRTTRTGLSRLLFFLFSLVIAMGIVSVAWRPAQRLVVERLLSTRPGSALVRFKIYEATLADLPTHAIVGWGTSRRVAGLPNRYSAGTHSGPLGTLYQRGVVGLALYIGLMASIWRPLLQQLRNRSSPVGLPAAFSTALLAFHFRELADLWAWDQLLTVATWTFWLAVLAHAAATLPLASPQQESPGALRVRT